MPRVVLPSDLANQFTDGANEISVEAGDMRALMREVDARFPGLKAALDAKMFVSIDGFVIPDPFLELLSPSSEVCFLPRIKGG
ncbi:MAG: MoaD/ThiS family protein [Pseudomonadota bacterium]